MKYSFNQILFVATPHIDEVIMLTSDIIDEASAVLFGFKAEALDVVVDDAVDI